jgi:D-methionine transport system ATP-binding protein
LLHTALIELKNLQKRFRGPSHSQPVLNDISLSIQPSSITGFIGRSGAGKSTLLRCLNLIETPDSGQIFIHHDEITQADPSLLKSIRRKIGIIPQTLELLNNRTVFKNIALPLEIAGVNKTIIQDKVEKTAELLGITSKLNSYPRQLSGGQKQRVAIARALVCDPNILLCDEFTSALDPETTQEILSLILKIRNLTGVTVVLITHDMSVIAEICDFVFVLDQGAIVEQGSVKSILTSPQHPTTQSLLQSNLRKGRLS